MTNLTPEDKPPLFQHWNGWYWVVTLAMVAQIVIYLLITLSFS